MLFNVEACKSDCPECGAESIKVAVDFKKEHSTTHYQCGTVVTLRKSVDSGWKVEGEERTSSCYQRQVSILTARNNALQKTIQKADLKVVGG